MIVQSYYSRSFYSDRLTERKYDALLVHGETLRSIKNELSELVNSDLMIYLIMSKIDFRKQMLPLIKDRVHSNFTKQLCDDVLKSYQNRFDSIKRRIIFEKVIKLEATFYKRAMKDNADNNSAKNIQGRVSDAVLRDTLLVPSKLGNGSYSPKNLKRFKVKEMLLSLRYTDNNQKEFQ